MTATGDGWEGCFIREDDGSDGSDFEREFERKAALAKSRIRVNSAHRIRPGSASRPSSSSSSSSTRGSSQSARSSARHDSAPRRSAESSREKTQRGNESSAGRGEGTGDVENDASHSTAQSARSWGSAHTASATYVPPGSRPSSARREGGACGPGHDTRSTSARRGGFPFPSARPASHAASTSTARDPRDEDDAPLDEESRERARHLRRLEASAKAAAEARRRVKEEQAARGGGAKYAAPMPSVTRRTASVSPEDLRYSPSFSGEDEERAFEHPGPSTSSSSSSESPPAAARAGARGGADAESAPPGSPFDKTEGPTFGTNKARATAEMGMGGIDQDELDAAMEVVEYAAMLHVDLTAEPELQWIAEEFWQAPLPEGWAEYEDAEGQPFYSNHGAGRDDGKATDGKTDAVSQWEHPLQRYYHSLVWMTREGNDLLDQRKRAEPPEEDELEEMATYAGVNLRTEPHLRPVIENMIAAPTPPGWSEDAETGAFTHVDSGKTVDVHPLDAYFVETIRRVRWERLRAEQVRAEEERRRIEAVGRTPEQRAAVQRILAAAGPHGDSNQGGGGDWAAHVLGLSAAEAASSGAKGKARAAYKKIALLVHPDKCLLPDAKRAFQLLTDAYKGFTRGGAGGTRGVTVPYGAAAASRGKPTRR